jgi:hypothetical protein
VLVLTGISVTVEDMTSGLLLLMLVIQVLVSMLVPVVL